MANRYTRIEELWFNDGTLVIQAEHSAFRVYKLAHAAESKHFDDLFLDDSRVPDLFFDLDSNTAIESLTLWQESGKDFESFLYAIFTPRYFESTPALLWSALLGILRLARKYRADLPYAQALQMLSRQFFHPTLESYLTSHWTPTHPPSEDHWLIHDGALYYKDLFTIVEFVLEIKANWLLPLLYYHICQETFYCLPPAPEG
ncbi:hypothetical protein K438DRAFT_1969962 [Mycena galopus ATCC 62051]|nr:hypothetical protein K438DRAFT_1969962 [Mycena galopus ATCC 62051]